MREQLLRQPAPLVFLGQIFLNEISDALRLPGWPSDGSLAFFYDPAQPWGFDPSDRGCSKILFFAESEKLQQPEAPEALVSSGLAPSHPLQFAGEWVLPSKPEDHGGMSIKSNPEAYVQLVESLMEDGYARSIHRLGGYPQEVQGELELECQLVTNGIYCGGSEGYKDPRRAELERGIADWQLVVQFDSEPELLRWEWGDAGRLFFWAKQQDIRTSDFENHWTILQCF